MTADVASDFTAACGMPNMNGVLEIELLDEFCEIVGVRVHVVAVPRLARTSVAAAVMSNASKATGGEIEHLVFERIGAERPAVAEDHRLPGAPVLVVDLCAVLGRNLAHGVLSFGRIGRGGRNVCLSGPCSQRGGRQAGGSGNAAGNQNAAT